MQSQLWQGDTRNILDWTLGENKPNSKPILFSPQIYLGVEKAIWKNKANVKMGNMALGQ